MESLKPILLLVVLGGVGYGVYVALNHAPRAEPAGAPAWNKDGAAPGDRGTSGGKSAVGISVKDQNASGPWKDPAASVQRNQDTWSNSPPTSSLPFGVGSTGIRPTATDPLLQSNSTYARATGIGPVDDGVSREASHSLNPGAPNAQSRHDYESARRAVQTLLAQGKLVEALRELSRWHNHPMVPPEDQTALADLLGQLSGTIVYSRQPWLAPNHVVKAGDSLESIAAQYQVPWQLLAKINGIEKPDGLLPGEELKVIRGPFHAQLDSQQQWLTLFVDGLYAGRFRIQTTGSINKPEGSYPVAKFGSGRPGVVDTGRHISLGGDLHLRTSDDVVSIPGAGLETVRISPQDMAEVYDMLSERSQVIIRR